ncbi:hypothetical protein [Streptomyces sp. NPDC051684]|uniref:hypothetical protein n=1 Tax=Streptomyces sp. NPDC051684 TaxID=3365670 RepID=UPI0037A366E7
MAATEYVRFQSTSSDERGQFKGVFGLVNNLSRDGRLTADQERFRRENNAWYDAAYLDPSTVDPTVYDPTLNPGATAWFKPSASHLIERVTGYLAILSAHEVPCHAVTSPDPGHVIYEDDVQVVVVPRAGAADPR